MKTNSIFKALSKTRYLALLVLLMFACAYAWADNIDTSDAEQLVEQTNIEQQSQSSHSLSNALSNEEDSSSTLLIGIICGVVSAVIMLFVIFAFLRPRLEILPNVAFKKVFDTKSQSMKLRCQIAVKNKSLFPCNNLQIVINHIGKDKHDEEGRKKLHDETILSIGGCLRSENDSVKNIEFNLEDFGIPEVMSVTILSQHSLSGIVIGLDHRFKVNDFVDGNYEKGILIEKGKTYKQAVMKRNTHTLKIVGILCSLLLPITFVGLYFLPVLTHTLYLLIMFTLVSTLSLCVIFWQLYIRSKTDAFSSVIAYHKIEHIERQMLVALLGTPEEKDNIRKSISLNNRAEDVEPEEVKENEK